MMSCSLPILPVLQPLPSINTSQDFPIHIGIKVSLKKNKMKNSLKFIFPWKCYKGKAGLPKTVNNKETKQTNNSILDIIVCNVLCCQFSPSVSISVLWKFSCKLS